jgi:hypothetical protein
VSKGKAQKKIWLHLESRLNHVTLLLLDILEQIMEFEVESEVHDFATLTTAKATLTEVKLQVKMMN